MSARELPRNSYYVRFFQADEAAGEDLSQQIRVFLEGSFPGNPDDFSWNYRVSSPKAGGPPLVVVILVPKAEGDRIKGKNLFFPALLVPELITQIPENRDGTLVIQHHDESEAVLIQNGRPVSSQYPYGGAADSNRSIYHYTTDKSAGPSAGSPGYPASTAPLKRIPIGREHKLSFNRDRSRSGGRLFYIIGLLLFYLLGVLTMQSAIAVQKQELRTLSGALSQRTRLEREADLVEDELRRTRQMLTEFSGETYVHPYRILSEIYLNTDASLQIRTIRVKGDTFTLTGFCRDPITITEGLTSSENMREITVSNLTLREDGYGFTLQGKYDDGI